MSSFTERELLDSDVADVNNLASAHRTTIAAAVFLDFTTALWRASDITHCGGQSR